MLQNAECRLLTLRDWAPRVSTQTLCGSIARVVLRCALGLPICSAGCRWVCQPRWGVVGLPFPHESNMQSFRVSHQAFPWHACAMEWAA
jgi:hypothetical protein